MSIDDSNPVTLLREDHRWMVRQLLQIDLELQRQHSRRSTGLERLIHLFRDIGGARVQRHHQIENVACERLRRKGLVRDESRLSALIEDHEALETLSNELLQAFELCRARKLAPETGLLRQAYGYVNRQLHHHADENRLLFPLLEQHLADDDWQAIRYQVMARPQTTEPGKFTVVPGKVS